MRRIRVPFKVAALVCALLTSVQIVTAQPASRNQELAREHNRQGIALQSQGKLHEAVAEYKLAISLNPDGAGYHNNLALALKDLDELDQAGGSKLAPRSTQA